MYLFKYNFNSSDYNESSDKIIDELCIGKYVKGSRHDQI
jgi:hypothetical protein